MIRINGFTYYYNRATPEMHWSSVFAMKAKGSALGFWRVAETNYHRLGGLKPQRLPLSWLWDQKSKAKVLAGPPSSRDSQRSSSRFWWLLASFLSLLPVSQASFLLVTLLWVFTSSSNDTSHWVETHPNAVRSPFHLIISPKALFPNKVTFIDYRGRTWSFWATKFILSWYHAHISWYQGQYNRSCIWQQYISNTKPVLVRKKSSPLIIPKTTEGIRNFSRVSISKILPYSYWKHILIRK